jgi:hypothetical protein
MNDLTVGGFSKILLDSQFSALKALTKAFCVAISGQNLNGSNYSFVLPD